MESSNKPPIEIKNRDPWLAVVLSQSLPGIGQIYARKTAKGILIIISHFFLTFLGGYLALLNDDNFWTGFILASVQSPKSNP